MENGERIEKWEDIRDLVFSYMCLIERMEKWKDENSFVWLNRKTKG